MKTIRLQNGVPSPEYDTSGMGMVHLVRDPRAIAHSQVSLSGKDLPVAAGRR